MDVWIKPEERGAEVEAVMGEATEYSDQHGVRVEVSPESQFIAPIDWPTRAHTVREDEIMAAVPELIETAETLGRLPTDVTLTVPHPWDILFSKLIRWEPKDRLHARAILREFPFEKGMVQHLDRGMPHRNGRVFSDDTVLRYEHHYQELCRWPEVRRALLTDR